MARLLKVNDEAIEMMIAEMNKKKNTFDLDDDEFYVTLPEIDDAICQVSIKPNAWNKITELIAACDKEVAWHCYMKRDTGTTFHIYDVTVFPQTVTAATVTSDDTEYAKWIMDIPDPLFEDLRCHMHSHVNMGVSPSGTDLTYQQQVTQNEEDFYFFMILNKKGDFWCRLVDVKNNILYEKNDIVIDIPKSETKEWVNQMIALYVKNPKPTKPTPRTYTYQDYQKEKLEQIKAEKEAPSDDDDDEFDSEFTECDYNRDWWRQFR